MVVDETIARLRREYKEYLSVKYPNFKESSVNTKVTDACFCWKNNITDSFWNIFVSDETMQSARQAIFEYLRDVKGSSTAKERADGYFRELCHFKEFIDAKYGSIHGFVGDEMRYDEIMFDYSLKVYNQELNFEDTADVLSHQMPHLASTSYKMVFDMFRCMMNGSVYKRRFNFETTIFILRKIAEKYSDRLETALGAVKENIVYYYRTSGSRSISLCRGCARVAKDHNIDISFGDDIFADVIPESAESESSQSSAVRYWLYAAGRDCVNWNQDYAEGIMALGWENIGDYSQYSSKEEIRRKLSEFNSGSRCTNAAHAIWQFCNDIQKGDIVIVKKGMQKIVGRGVVTGDYEYDAARGNYRNIRKVEWTHNGEWDYPGNGVMKTLTDLTPYTEIVSKVNELFQIDDTEISAPKIDTEEYTIDDFLNEVYINAEQYDTIKNLLLMKKNLIIQGAPGVGKTYAAKRLAYSIMGEKDESRIKMVQFHQSYSYEDFIMGYRPTENGFALAKGVFYDFCKQAEMDERPHFFIIDEINRGNLSKIFGELFMLIERDKRGKKLQLLYSDEQFNIPANVYIIGMMNTADRSLAMLDYALRRRFAFYELSPAFDSEGFKVYQASLKNEKFNTLIECVKRLNESIAQDDSLGEGFRIGHSYFSLDNLNASEQWLKAVVEYELIPLLKEYWFDEQDKIYEWSAKLRDAIK